MKGWGSATATGESFFNDCRTRFDQKHQQKSETIKIGLNKLIIGWMGFGNRNRASQLMVAEPDPALMNLLNKRHDSNSIKYDRKSGNVTGAG